MTRKELVAAWEECQQEYQGWAQDYRCARDEMQYAERHCEDLEERMEAIQEQIGLLGDE